MSFNGFIDFKKMFLGWISGVLEYWKIITPLIHHSNTPLQNPKIFFLNTLYNPSKVVATEVVNFDVESLELTDA